MWRSAFVLMAAVLLGGCAGVVQRAAEAHDTALESAEWTICHGASVGSIRRAYGSPDRAAVWRQLCDQAGFDPGL